MQVAQLPPAQTSSRPALRLAPSPAFSCLADPGVVDVYLDDEGKAHVLPQLRRIYHRPGVGGTEVRMVPDPVTGESRAWPNPAQAIARAVSAGAVLVPYGWELDVFGEKVPETSTGINYCIPHPVQSGGIAHRLPWERPVVAGITLRWRWDWKGYLTWLRKVEQLIGEPEPEVLEAVRFALLRKWRSAGQGSPVARANAEVFERQLRSLGWLPGVVVPVAAPAAPVSDPPPVAAAPAVPEAASKPPKPPKPPKASAVAPAPIEMPSLDDEGDDDLPPPSRVG